MDISLLLVGVVANHLLWRLMSGWIVRLGLIVCFDLSGKSWFELLVELQLLSADVCLHKSMDAFR